MKVNSIEYKLCMKDDHILSLEDIVIKLHLSMEEMESHLCCCMDQKKELELEEEEVKEQAMEDLLEYTSSDEYETPPMGEIHLIEDVPNSAGPLNCCGHSLEEAIEVSDNKEESVVENKVPIPILVECSHDRVVHGQCAVCGHFSIHCTIPSFKSCFISMG